MGGGGATFETRTNYSIEYYTSCGKDRKKIYNNFSILYTENANVFIIY